MRSISITSIVFLFVAILVAGVLPLWLDEILQLLETRNTSTAEMIGNLPRNSGAVPLGYLVQQASLRITGYSLRAARLPAVLFGSGTVFLVGLLAKELGLKRAWLAAGIFAIFPLTLRYSTEARVYSQALFFSVLAVFLYLRLAQKPGVPLTLLYWLALTAAVYTQPYAVFVGLGTILWSLLYRDRKPVLWGTTALAITILTFLPWYFWSKTKWAIGIVTAGLHFSASVKTPLMLFREFAGAGYWGSGLLLILCALALWKRSQVENLLALLIAVPAVCAFGADAVFDYFVAARQFIWILPAVAILAAMAVERNLRSGRVLVALLCAVCVWQNIRFFTAPHEDWQAAAAVMANAVKQGSCLMIEPPDGARFYRFFQPELQPSDCAAPQIVLGFPPYASPQQRQTIAAHLISRGYKQESEQNVGKSEIVFFHR